MIKADPPFDGPIAGMTVDADKLARNFFDAIGWDPQTLVPSRESMEKLGLADVAESLSD